MSRCPHLRSRWQIGVHRGCSAGRGSQDFSPIVPGAAPVQTLKLRCFGSRWAAGDCRYKRLEANATIVQASRALYVPPVLLPTTLGVNKCFYLSYELHMKT